MSEQNNKSNVAFLRWTKPVSEALKELDGQGKSAEVSGSE